VKVSNLLVTAEMVRGHTPLSNHVRLVRRSMEPKRKQKSRQQGEEHDSQTKQQSDVSHNRGDVYAG